MSVDMRTRDLYIIGYAPTLGTGRAMRSFTCVKALAMLGPVDLAYVPLDGDEPSPEYQRIENIEFHKIIPSRGLRRAATYASKRLQGVPAICCRGTSPEVIEAGEALASIPGRGRVVVDGAAAATALMPMARRRPVIYNAHNIESERPGYRSLSRLEIRRYERRLLKVAAESWMVSYADVKSARELVPTARLRYVPNAVDVAAIRPREGAHGDRRIVGKSLLMVADFRYPPNRSGRDFLVQSVLPLVWHSMPEVRLTLVGRGLEDWRSPDPRIEVAGFVDDLAPVYAASDCVVVPLIEGAGTPLKFVEALAYGIPIVATPFAANGLEVIPDRHYREGSDKASFAQGVLDVLRNGTPEKAAEARRLAEAEYSIEALAKRIATSSHPADPSGRHS
jgi:polysaccharide biosynthesis protein PslH